MIDIRLEGKLPIYEQLYNGIAQLISAGRLLPDEKLPAVREVAKQLGINPNTVQKAYSQLEQAGLIYSRPAMGSYVASENDAAKALRSEALDRLNTELIAAKRSGIVKEEVFALADEIWTAEKGDSND